MLLQNEVDMLAVLQVLTVLVVTVPVALVLAHALELPGKMRLSKDDYLVVQRIYYPGFTIGGAAEPLAILLIAILLFLTPYGPAFWLTLIALLSLVAMHAAYWLVTHPVNRFWVEGVDLDRLGGGFFSFGSRRPSGSGGDDWTLLRDRWEMSHVVRAALGGSGIILLASAIAAT